MEYTTLSLEAFFEFIGRCADIRNVTQSETDGIKNYVTSII